MSPAAKTTLVEPLLDLNVQTIAIPELRNGILVKTRKDLSEDIKGDAALYQKFLDNIEPTERRYHEDDPADELKRALAAWDDRGTALG